MPSFSVQVPADFQGSLRLDKYIASLPDGMNRSKLKSCAIEILVNGETRKFSTAVKALDIIDVQWDDNVPDDITAENIALSVLYEDENVAVIDKAQGMVTHPAAGNWTGTLVNALLYRWGRASISRIKDMPPSLSASSRRPGIVHRLDKDTSGIIITAKNRDAEEWLGQQFARRFVQKEYIAIVKGRPPALAGDIKTQIIRDPKNRKRFKAATQTEDGKSARTIYRCIASYGNYSLMRVRLKTGRTHQIRVHMKYIGCPILGDALYGKKDDVFPEARLMLHAKKLTIRLPTAKKFSTFRSAVPERFRETLAALKKKYPKEVPVWGKNHAKKKS